MFNTNCSDQITFILYSNTDINNQPVNLNSGDNNNPCCQQSQLINGSHHALRSWLRSVCA